LLEGEAGSLDQERQEEELVEEELVEEELVEEVEIEEGTRDRKNKRKKIGTKNPQNFFFVTLSNAPLVVFISLWGPRHLQAKARTRTQQEHKRQAQLPPYALRARHAAIQALASAAFFAGDEAAPPLLLGEEEAALLPAPAWATASPGADAKMVTNATRASAPAEPKKVLRGEACVVGLETVTAGVGASATAAGRGAAAGAAGAAAARPASSWRAGLKPTTPA
jgi:hypothetical protein